MTLNFFSSLFNLEYWIYMLMSLPAILFALSMHELAHGWVSYKLGDPTPKMQGRLTLNPMAHLDLVGTLFLIFLHFGWAKPVQINSKYYKHPRTDIVLVSLAGVTMNFILAILSAAIFAGFEKYFGMPNLNSPSHLYDIFMMMIYYGVLINIGLGVFNLLPIPPLDGSKVLFSVLPYRFYNFILKYEQYGMFILLILMVTNVLSAIMDPTMNFLLNFVFSLVGIR